MARLSIEIIRTPVVKQVARTIGRHEMFAPGDRVLAAVSGGADSTALLHILHALAPEIGIELAVAHLNHGLRGPAADGDAQFVQDMAGRLGLTFHGERIHLDPNQGSLEERCRRARYAFLDRLAEEDGYTKIALGHHMDDNAEAVLLHLLRGSGIRGMSGIPPVRGPRIVRPLMDLRRAQISNFLMMQRIAFVEDASNADLRFDRNRIRQHLIPFLRREFNPNVAAVLHRTADLCWQEELWLQTLLNPVLKTVVSSIDPESMVLGVQNLAAQPLAAQRRLIRDGLRRWLGNLKGIRADHIDALVGLLAPHSEGKRLCLPNRIKAERSRSQLRFSIRPGRGWDRIKPSSDYLYLLEPPIDGSLAMEIPECGLKIQFSVLPNPTEGYVDRTDVHTAWFDMDQIDFPLSIRNFRPGDRLRPIGLAGHQKIKKIFGDRKIPIVQRHRTPLLVSGNGILWVAGIRRSALAVVGPGTTRVLKVRIIKNPAMNGRQAAGGATENPG